jgi:hypothetical protein
MNQLKAKFVGGPRDKKTRGLQSPKIPTVIEVPEDCKFHNIRGRYVFKELTDGGNIAFFTWVSTS